LSSLQGALGRPRAEPDEDQRRPPSPPQVTPGDPTG